MITERDKFLSRLAMLDTETTGKDYKTCEVIEMGLSFKENGEWKEVSQLYKPDEPIKPECSAVTNITNRMVADEKSFFEDAIGWQTTVEEVVQTKPIIGVAHNSFYDEKVLERYGFTLQNWLCTFKIAKKPRRRQIYNVVSRGLYRGVYRSFSGSVDRGVLSWR